MTPPWTARAWGSRPTAKVPSVLPSLARSFVTLLPFATQMLAPSNARPSGELSTAKLLPVVFASYQRSVATCNGFRPTGPCGPAGPVAPVGPCGPCGPAGPVAPVGPCRPAGPVAPVGPCGPCGPAEPVAPVGPCGPVWFQVSVFSLLVQV